MARLIMYERNGRDWKEVFRTDDQLTVYKGLTGDLIAKKICECSYIARVNRIQNYDGTIDIHVFYSGGDSARPHLKAVYTISEH